MGVLANAMVVIMLQYISDSTQALYTLNLTQCYISIICQWSWKGRECPVTAGKQHRVHRDNKAIYSWLQREENDFCGSSKNSQTEQSHPDKAVKKLPQGPGRIQGKIRCLPLSLISCFLWTKEEQSTESSKIFLTQFLQLVAPKGTPLHQFLNKHGLDEALKCSMNKAVPIVSV